MRSAFGALRQRVSLHLSGLPAASEPLQVSVINDVTGGVLAGFCSACQASSLRSNALWILGGSIQYCHGMDIRRVFKSNSASKVSVSPNRFFQHHKSLL